MAEKEFKTIDEQISLLRSRGLIIENEEDARRFLLYNNYYRVSGYSLTLRKHDVFNQHATMQNIMDIYHFDHAFRHLLLKYLDKIETRFKSVYAYHFSAMHGPTGYLDASLFTDQDIYHDTMNKAETQKFTRLPHEAYLKHFVEERMEPIPLWAYVDLFTIGNVSMLYAITDPAVKKQVAWDFGLTMKKGAVLLGEFMHSMTILRNLCAHGSRLYNRLFNQKPSIRTDDKRCLRHIADGTPDNAHLYGYIFVMKRLLAPEESTELLRELIALTEQYSFVRMKYYGFRDDWKSALA